MMNMLFAEAIYDLHKKHGELARRIQQLERKAQREMSQVDTVVQELGQLKSDLASKFGEVQTELNKIETEKGEGKEVDLTAIKSLIADADQAVRTFDPTQAASGSGSGAAPSGGGAPSGGAPGEAAPSAPGEGGPTPTA